MADTSAAEFDLEIAHVLFMDIVGYSKLLVDEQRALANKLNQAVRATEQFIAAEAAGKLIRLPTGDGMALAFFTNPEAPLKCAIETSRALAHHPEVRVRMGIHSGPVSSVTDVNDRSNVAGAGINIAQRVMDCGDAGHILLSKRIADDLAQYGRWRSELHDLGVISVKHGVEIGVVNFYSDEVGNSALPATIAARREQEKADLKSEGARSHGKRRTRQAIAAGSILVVAAVAFFAYRAWRTPAADGIRQKSIAVLPLENLSEDKADAFFADGIQDDVLTSLAKVSDLKVISRTSVMQYRGAQRNLREIGRLLGVSNILEGSVRRVGNRVLVNVQLIDAIHDKHLWAERYDRTVSNSIGLQGELASEIARELRAKLSPEEKTRLVTRPTNNPEAYVLYLQAREKEKTAYSSPQESIAVDALYDRAVALDPQFASAMARQSVWNSGIYKGTRIQEWKAKAQALAVQALRIAPDLPEAHIALGEWFRLTERNYDAALKELQVAAATMPNDSEILGHLGYVYRRQGRWREALANFRRVQELDPSIPHPEEAETTLAIRDWKGVRVLYRRLLELAPDDVGIKTGFAIALMSGEGDFAAARAVLQTIPYPRYDTDGQPVWDDVLARWRLLMLERDYAGAEKLLVDFPLEQFVGAPGLKDLLFGVTASAQGDQASALKRYEKVRTEWERALRERPDDLPIMAHLGMLYASLGRKEEALRLSQRALDLLPANDAIERPAYSSNLALVYAWTGESEKAVTLIEQLLTKPAVDVEGFEPITLTILRSWTWDVLRTNPRFNRIIEGPEPKTVY